MSVRYSISHKGQEIGPFTKEEILQKVKKSELSNLDYIYLEDKSDWVPLAEFIPSLASPRAPATPPPSPAKPRAQAPKTPPPNKSSTSASKDHLTVIKPSAAATSASTSTSAATAAALTTTTKTGTVQIKDGVGTIEILQYTSGTVQLTARDEKPKGLHPSDAEELKVRAAPATRLTLSGPAEIVVDENATIAIEAQDKWGNHDTEFTGTFTAVVASSNDTKSDESKHEVKISGGRGSFPFTTQKADTFTISLTDTNRTGLDISMTVDMTFIAGPASRLLIDPPAETIAGQPVKLQVKAIDKFGNIATSYNSDIKVEVITPTRLQKAS